MRSMVGSWSIRVSRKNGVVMPLSPNHMKKGRDVVLNCRWELGFLEQSHLAI